MDFNLQPPDLMSIFRSPAPQNGPVATPPKNDATPAKPGPWLPGTGDDKKGGIPQLDYAMEVFGNFADGISDMVTGGGDRTTAPKPGPLAGPAEKPKPKTVADYGTLDKGLDSQVKSNRDNRSALDLMKKNGDAKAGKSETDLNTDRTKLLTDLKERSGVYNTDIKAIEAKLGSKPIKTPNAEQKKLLDEKAALIKGRDKYSDQQKSLQRWDDRNHINQINEKLNDPNLAPAEKTKLLADKRGLATGLLSTVKHYEQFAEPWGETSYGKGRGFSSMREAGCGPTALADLMDFADQEDPEGKASRGIKDYYNPRRVADYAEGHGRVKGSGTDGARMFRDLPMGFDSFSGQTISNVAGARTQLENGMPVAFLGHDVAGQGADGKRVPAYGGHFMVLNGVSEDGSNYNVTDGGRNNSRNIHTMTRQQLTAGGDGFWGVNR